MCRYQGYSYELHRKVQLLSVSYDTVSVPIATNAIRTWHRFETMLLYQRAVIAKKFASSALLYQDFLLV